jgi:hypothetical protein
LDTDQVSLNLTNKQHYSSDVGVSKPGISWRMILFYVLPLLVVFSAINCALVSVVVSNQKDYTISHDTNWMTSKDSDEPVATAGAVYDTDNIHSDMDPDEFSSIGRVNLVFGDGGESSHYSTVSLIPTGFARVPCNTTQFPSCQSNYTVHMFTNEGVVIYHGEDTFLANPSDRLKSLVEIHHPEQKALQLSSHQHIHLNWGWMFVWMLVRRSVTKWVWKRAKGWVLEQVMEWTWEQA